MNSSGRDKRKELLEAKVNNIKDLKLGSDRTKERVLACDISSWPVDLGAVRQEKED